MDPAIVCAKSTSTPEDYQNQVSVLEAFCESNEFHIVKTFKISRYNFRSVMKYLNNDGVIRYLVISDLGTLGSLEDLRNMIACLSRKRVCLISIKEQLITIHPDQSTSLEFVDSDKKFAPRVQRS